MRILIFAVFLLFILLLVFGTTAYYKPHIVPPSNWHPKSVVYKTQGVDVQPWTPLEPERKYVIEYWDIKWPVFRKDFLDYEGYLDYVVQGFMALYPNVRVETRLFDLSLDADWLLQAASTGDLPDVVCAPFESWIAERGLLVDLSPFLGLYPPGSFVSACVEANTYQGRFWAFPRWLEPDFMVANRRLLGQVGIDAESICKHGWTWDDFAATAQSLRIPNVTPLILNTSGVRPLEKVVCSLSGRALLLDGELGWTEYDLARTVELLNTLSRAQIISSPPAKLENAMLEHFWSERAAIIGPVSSGLLRHIRERQESLIILPESEKKARDIEVALLPIPADSPEHIRFQAGMLSLMVFRSDEPAQMRAAAEFARFLATTDLPKITEALQVVSCYTPLVSDTVDLLRACECKHWISDALASGTGIVLPLDTLFSATTSLKKTRIESVLRAFWQKPSTAEELLEAVRASLEQPLESPTKR